MRILHVISSMAAEAGGPPAICAGIAGQLAARGHAVTIATLRQPALTRVTVDPAREVLDFPADRPGGYGQSAALAAWLNTHVPSFDIVHLHSLWQFPTFSAARACWNHGIPYVVLLNGMLDRYSVQQRSAWKKRLYWWAREGKIEGRAAGLHCGNRAEIRRAMPWIQHMPKFIVGNAISAADAARVPTPGRFRAAHPELSTAQFVLFLSRLHPKKGLDRLIPAWKHFAQKAPGVKFVIAGTGDAPYVSALDTLIKTSGMSDHILRVGQLTGDAKWDALADAAAFVLPSHQEGFSMAITEALAAGCVPVVTQECNFDELSEHDCGIIIANGDMQKFAHAAAELIADPPRRARVAANAQAFVRDFCTWDKVAQQLERVYTWIKSGRPLPADGAPVWR